MELKKVPEELERGEVKPKDLRRAIAEEMEAIFRENREKIIERALKRLKGEKK